MVTEVKPLQPEKALEPIEVTELPMVTEVKPLQSLKADSPIDVTLLGMIIEVKPLQPEKADSPIDVTLLGMITEVNPLQEENADSPMEVTSSPITILFIDLRPEKYEPISVQWNSTVDRLLQPSNARVSIEVTLLGIVMEVRPVHS